GESLALFLIEAFVEASIRVTATNDHGVKHQPRTLKEGVDQVLIERLAIPADVGPLDLLGVAVFVAQFGYQRREIAATLPRHPNGTESVVSGTVYAALVATNQVVFVSRDWCCCFSFVDRSPKKDLGFYCLRLNLGMPCRNARL